jgi:hypothetical protein
MCRRGAAAAAWQHEQRHSTDIRHGKMPRTGSLPTLRWSGVDSKHQYRVTGRSRSACLARRRRRPARSAISCGKAHGEVGTLTRLKACRAIIDGLIASYRGRIFSTAGDSETRRWRERDSSPPSPGLGEGRRVVRRRQSGGKKPRTRADPDQEKHGTVADVLPGRSPVLAERRYGQTANCQCAMKVTFCVRGVLSPPWGLTRQPRSPKRLGHRVAASGHGIAWVCAPRRVGDVSPIPLGRYRHVLWSAAVPELDRAASSTRSDGVSGRHPTL